ncbi:MAG: hypothetical protein AB3N22_07235 [Ruegeria sp.]
MSDGKYLEALDLLSKQSHTQIGIFAVPLGIVLVQLRFISQIDSLLLSIVTTTALVSLFVGVAIAWWMWVLISGFQAKEVLTSGQGFKRGCKGSVYLAWYEGQMAKSNIQLTEDWITSHISKFEKPVLFSAIAGYGSLFLMLLIVVWSVP